MHTTVAQDSAAENIYFKFTGLQTASSPCPRKRGVFSRDRYPTGSSPTGPRSRPKDSPTGTPFRGDRATELPPRLLQRRMIPRAQVRGK